VFCTKTLEKFVCMKKRENLKIPNGSDFYSGFTLLGGRLISEVITVLSAVVQERSKVLELRF
jgi:hypothetical protein